MAPTEHRVADVDALHAVLGGDASAVLIGHDWGARIATGAAVLAQVGHFRRAAVRRGRRGLPHLRPAAQVNLAAALGYYRATIGGTGMVPEFQVHEDAIAQTPTQPHLYLHGADDGCMGADLAARAPDFMPVPGSRAEIVDGTGHFLHLERPEAVTALILDFLRD